MDIWKQLEIAGNTLVGKTVDGTKISRLESKVEEIEKEIQVGCRKLGAYIIEKDLQIGDEEAVRKIRSGPDQGAEGPDRKDQSPRELPGVRDVLQCGRYLLQKVRGAPERGSDA